MIKEPVYACSSHYNYIIDTVAPDGLTTHRRETYEQVLERYPDAVLVDFNEWLAKKAELQNTPVEWTETTEENYWYALECLPPAKMAAGNFLVGEPYDHSAGNGLPRFQMYRKSGNRYYVSNRPVTKIEFKNLLNIA